MEHLLWYDQPATCWNDALPVGNGRLGGMLFSGPDHERIALNDDTLWSGRPHGCLLPDSSEAYRQARERALAGDLHGAQSLIEETMCGPYTQSYLPMGDLTLQWDAEERNRLFRRSLDIRDAVASVWTEDGGGHDRIERTCFVTAPRNALIYRIKASKPLRRVTIWLTSQLESAVRTDGCLIWLDGYAPVHADPAAHQSDKPIRYEDERGQRGIRFGCAACITTDGQICPQGDKISIFGARYAMVALCSKTSFVDYKTSPDDQLGRCIEECKAMARQAAAADYDMLAKEHMADYHRLYNRCSLELGGKGSSLATDARLRGEIGDPGLYELLFGYGRYLLICCSRLGTQPANLQGIWNELLMPPWSSNYTLNINTEMNYWHAFSTNLDECAQPVAAMLRELSEAGNQTARVMYGAPGFAVHHNTDLWRHTTPTGMHGRGKAGFAFWNMAGPWLCRTVWEMYEYTLDDELLRRDALPALRAALDFAEALLIPDGQGYWRIGPTTSPENRFVYRGEECAVTMGTAMTDSLMLDLCDMAQKAALDAGDESLATRTAALRPKLHPIDIGSDGRIREWDKEYEETDIHHRHISHLYGVYPAELIDQERTPALARAARESLRARGDDGTGWSLAWKICQWARLRDGDHALKMIDRQLQLVEAGEADNHLHGGTYPNMLCAHPPFQIDGNMGAAAGIAEMLLQSSREEITLLPALPARWENGSVRGLRARGAITVDMRWDKGRVTEYTLCADKGAAVTLHVNGQARAMVLAAGEKIHEVLTDGQ